MSQYQTSFEISRFAGLNQSGDGHNISMQFAREMENVNISGMGFKPMREGRRISQTLHDPIGTLAYLHRRYGTEGTLLVAISNGSVYTKVLDGDDEWVERFSSLTVNDCDWVTYEISQYPDYSSTKTYNVGERVMYSNAPYRCKTKITTAESWNGSHWEQLGADPTDILLFTNATDGMFCLYGDTLDVLPVTTPKRFGIIARYNERIWGSGIIGDPDMLVYSVPFDPFDWSANPTIPEDGAGDILQPTWDGDCFIGLKQYGNVLLAVKRNSIWRVSGTNPGEFSMQQQYGGGTIAENTVAVYNDYAYMLGEYGLMRYDGSGAFPFRQEDLRTLMREEVTRKVDTETFRPYNPMNIYYPNNRCLYNGAYYVCRESTRDGITSIEGLRCEMQIPGSGSITVAIKTGETTPELPYLVMVDFLTAVGTDRRERYAFQYDGEDWTLDEETVDIGDYGFNLPVDLDYGTGTVLLVNASVARAFNSDNWSQVSSNPMLDACAGMWNGVYCLALPVDGSDIPNAILQYEPLTGCFSLRTDVSVKSFLQINERLLYTSAQYPGMVFELDDTRGDVKPVKWVSGYQDLGVKSSIKSAFILYAMVECEVPVDLYLGIRTEKKFKEKKVTIRPGKLKRVNLNLQGRIFRLEIRSYQNVPYVIAGGIKVDLELDPD